MITVEDVRNKLQSTCPKENLECQKCLDKIRNLDDDKISAILEGSDTKDEVFNKLFSMQITSLSLPPNNKTKYIVAINEWIKRLQVLGINCIEFEPTVLTTEQRREYVLKAIQDEGKSAKYLATTLMVSERTIRKYIKEIRNKYNIDVSCRITKEKKNNGKRKSRKYLMPNTLHKIDMVMTIEELLIIFKALKDLCKNGDFPMCSMVGYLGARMWKQLENYDNNNYAQNRIKQIMQRTNGGFEKFYKIMERTNEEIDASKFDYDEYKLQMDKDDVWGYILKRRNVEVIADYKDEDGKKIHTVACKMSIEHPNFDVAIINRIVPKGEIDVPKPEKVEKSRFINIFLK